MREGAVGSKFPGKAYVVCFDDLCDATLHTLDIIEKCKVKWPDFKVTLFTIPARTSQATIEKAWELDSKYRQGYGLGQIPFDDPWILLAPHGFYHTRGECLGWTRQEATDKIMLAKERGIDAPIFRAPAWLIDADTYRACADLGYAVASHTDFRIPLKLRDVEVKEYVYNDVRYRAKGTRAIHGHLSGAGPVKYVDNYIGDMWEDGRLGVPKKRTYMSTVEAAVLEGAYGNPVA